MSERDFTTRDPRAPHPEGEASTERGETLPLDAFLDVVLDVRAELGRTRISIERAMRIQEGTVIELDKMAGDPLDLVINGRLVARGEAVVVGDRLGIRVLEVIPTDRNPRSRRS